MGEKRRTGQKAELDCGLLEYRHKRPLVAGSRLPRSDFPSPDIITVTAGLIIVFDCAEIFDDSTCEFGTIPSPFLTRSLETVIRRPSVTLGPLRHGASVFRASRRYPCPTRAFEALAFSGSPLAVCWLLTGSTRSATTEP